MTSSSRPPQPQEGYVFAVSGSSLIDAPPHKVWGAILDFKSYKLWNPFIRHQAITDSRKNLLPDQTLSVGCHLHISRVHLPPTLDDASAGIFNKSSALCIVTAVDHEQFKVAWCTWGIPRWILWTERWQWLTETENDIGDGRGQRKFIKYESVEVFGGFAAYFVKWFVGSKLNLGFQSQADGLKRWVEMKS